MQMKIQKLDPQAKVPTYAHPGDAGMDLYAFSETVIQPGKVALIPTGIALALPRGCVGLIWDKSGVAGRHGLKVMGGVIDQGYRGEVRIGLFNTTRKRFTFQAGDKVAQLLVQRIERPKLTLARSLSTTERGTGAFGSTGKK